jgi:hypothetical protein
MSDKVTMLHGRNQTGRMSLTRLSAGEARVSHG